jgi:hypothetical protein
MPDGQTPTLLAAWNDGANTTAYVVLASPSSTTSATILAYTVDGKGAFSTPVMSSISVSFRIVSAAATANQLFLLQADGSVWSSPISADHKIANAVQVQVNKPVAAPLATSAQNFTASTSVPTSNLAPQKGSVFLTISLSQNSPAILSTAMITAADGTSQYHLFIGDPVNHRVLDLTPPQPMATAGGPGSTPTTTSTSTTQGSSPTLTLVQQYASPDYFNPLKGMAIDPGGTTINILGQHTSSSEDLMVINTDPQKVCAS